MKDDGDLLRHFAERQDQACFRELVERRIGFVYAVNLRRLRDPHLAHDATQAVFVALARKAAAVARGPSVIGWLHRSSFYESRNLMRAQAHRIERESEAQRLGTAASDPQPAADQAALEAVLDEVLRELPDADREAVFARFFCDQSYAQLGGALNISENAARMRVDRALGRLREQLQRRGLSSTAAVLSAALPACASATVPAGLIATVADAAIAGLSLGALPVAFWTFMSTTKIAASVAALAVVGGVAYQIHKTAQLESSLVTVREEHAQATSKVVALERQIGELKAVAVQAAAATFAPRTPAPATVVRDEEEPTTPGVTRKAPAGWHKNGSSVQAYDVGVDELNPWGGMPSAYASSKPGTRSDVFGGMMQTTSAESYQSKRVRMTGWVKTKDANDGGGHLWLRVDGQNGVLQFDNMDGRAPKGTTDWQEYSIVLDVPPEATTLNYGFFVGGAGKMWVNGVTIDPVGPEIPTTDLRSRPKSLPKAPVNLGFSPKNPAG